MAIMVTGGTGFLGSYLVRRLVEQGEKDVVVFDTTTTLERLETVKDKVHMVQGDVTELSEVLGAIDKYGVERIAHMAFYLSTGLNRFPARGIKVDIDGTVNIFEAARLARLKRVVYASSITQYGMRDAVEEPELDEDFNPRPSGVAVLYGACKQFTERCAEFYTREYGLELIGMRPTSIYGWGRGGRATGPASHFMVLPEVAALGTPVTLPPDDMAVDWMYAADAAYALHLALVQPLPEHRVFNMTSERVPHRVVTQILRELLPDARIEVGTEYPSMMRPMSNRRLREELGYRPQYSLRRGLHEYLSIVRARAGLPPLQALAETA